MAKQEKSSALHDAAKRLGHAGGVKGGPARARRLSQEERSEIARKAAEVRWRKARLAAKTEHQKHKAKLHLEKHKKKDEK